MRSPELIWPPPRAESARDIRVLTRQGCAQLCFSWCSSAGCLLRNQTRPHLPWAATVSRFSLHLYPLLRLDSLLAHHNPNTGEEAVCQLLHGSQNRQMAQSKLFAVGPTGLGRCCGVVKTNQSNSSDEHRPFGLFFCKPPTLYHRGYVQLPSLRDTRRFFPVPHPSQIFDTMGQTP